MKTLIIILIYLLIGVLLHLVGPLAKELKKEFAILRKKPSPGESAEDVRKENLKFEIKIWAIVIVLYPIIYMMIGYNKLKAMFAKK